MPPTYPRSCVSTGDRCWYTYTPPQVDSGSTYPLVVDLHGGGGCASHSAASSGWQKLAEGNDEDDTFIVIWPQGSGGGLWGVGGSEWSTINAETSTTGKDTFDAPDLEFLAEIIASSNAPIDLERIYFTGFSMGCMMSLRFLLERSDLIAGAHCHGGYLVSPEDGTSITPSKSVGVYMTGGDEDAWYAMSEDQFDVWTNFNDDECVESTTSVTLTGSYLTDATLKRCGNVGRLVVSVWGGRGGEKVGSKKKARGVKIRAVSTTVQCTNLFRSLQVAGMTHVPDERMASLAWEALKGLSRTSVTDALPEDGSIEEENEGNIESTLLEGGGMLTEALGFWTTSFAVLVTILGNF